MELLLGCGSNWQKRLIYAGASDWQHLETLDHNADHKPDLVWDLNQRPLPYGDDRFDEIHAYEVLEHIGRQGDAEGFFAEWSEYWRLLKPGGMFFGTCPAPGSPWVWGDPSHTRAIQPEHLIFLVQPNYAQVGATPMSDFRSIYKCDFDILHNYINGLTFEFVLRAVKPSRLT